MPYSCARAICLTFCWPIRWALTPIFGQSFIKDCFSPEHAGFGRFKISIEVIRCAQLDAEGLRSGPGSHSATPAAETNGYASAAQEIPQPAPLKELRPRKEPPTFKLGSPFESDSEASERNYIHTPTPFESPELSPKTTRFHASPGWTSINREHRNLTPPSPPNNTPVGSLSYSLLTEPRTMPATSWRALDGMSAVPKVTKMPTCAHDKHRIRKRRLSVDEDADGDFSGSPSGDSSESDDVDIIISPAGKKRQRYEDTPDPASTAPSSTASSTPSGMKTRRSMKYTATDARAAQWLLNLSMRDSQLAMGPEELRGRKRRSSVV